MSKEVTAQSLLQQIRAFIEDKDISANTELIEGRELIEKYLLSSLSSNKEINANLHSGIRDNHQGTFGKMKNLIITKISNIVLNIVERPLIKQQKANNDIYLIVEFLLKENAILNSKLKENRKSNE